MSCLDPEGQDGYGATEELGQATQEKIEQLGLRLYHVWLLLFTYIIQLCPAAVVLALPFLQESMSDEFMLSKTEFAMASTAILAGAAPGCWIFGPMMDRIGRRPTFGIAVLGLMAVSVAHQAMPAGNTCVRQNCFLLLLGLRLVLGLFFGALAAFSNLIFAELLPKGSRGVLLSLSSLGWSLGTYYVIAMAILTQGGWRLLCIAPVPVCAIALFCLCIVPESPRWLSANGCEQEAEQILDQVATSNILLRPVSDGRAVPKSGNMPQDPVGPDWKGHRPLLGRPGLKRDLKIIFGPKYLLTSLCMATVHFIAHGMSYAMLLFQPAILKAALGSDRMPYAIFALGEAVGTAGFMLTCCSLDSLGRRLTLAGIFALTGIFTTLFAIIPSTYWWFMTLHCLCNIVSAGLWPAMMTFTTECYPTAVRGTGTAMCHGAGRLGAVVAPIVAARILDGSLSFALPGIQETTPVLFVFVGLFYCVGSVAVILNPRETANRELD